MGYKKSKARKYFAVLPSDGPGDVDDRFLAVNAYRAKRSHRLVNAQPIEWYEY